MNHRQRHLQYKRSVYAKRQTGLILWTVLATLAAVLLLLLIVGNILGDRIEADRMSGESGTKPPAKEETGLTPPAAIAGTPVYLLNKDGAPLGSLESQYRNLSPATDALTLSLDSSNGTLRYRSAVAAALGGREVISGAKSLGTMLSAPNNRGFYISASLHLVECGEKDPLIRSAKLSAVASLIGEALNAGADDLLLLAPDATVEQLPELIALAETAHALAPDGVIGLALSQEILADPALSSHLEALSEVYHYMAIDASQNGENDAKTHVSSLLSANRFYAIRYRMRLIVPNGTAEQNDALVAFLTEQKCLAEMGGWQFAYS